MRAIAPVEGRRVPLNASAPCWVWPGARHSEGYGIVMIDGSTRFVHRLAYQLHVGPIQRSHQVDHVCHSLAAQAGQCDGGASCLHRACWNPAHLEAVSSRENSMRGNHPLFAVARTGVCRRGHDLTVSRNVYVRVDGRRRCRVCTRDRRRERKVAA